MLIGYLGCNVILVLVVWFLAVTLITAAYAGAMASIVDIAPNFAGKSNIGHTSTVLPEHCFSINFSVRRPDIGLRSDDPHVREFLISSCGWFAHPEKRKSFKYSAFSSVEALIN